MPNDCIGSLSLSVIVFLSLSLSLMWAQTHTCMHARLRTPTFPPSHSVYLSSLSLKHAEIAHGPFSASCILPKVSKSKLFSFTLYLVELHDMLQMKIFLCQRGVASVLGLTLKYVESLKQKIHSPWLQASSLCDTQLFSFPATRCHH